MVPVEGEGEGEELSEASLDVEGEGEGEELSEAASRYELTWTWLNDSLTIV